MKSVRAWIWKRFGNELEPFKRVSVNSRISRTLVTKLTYAKEIFVGNRSLEWKI
jgi:hypothetical protein